MWVHNVVHPLTWGHLPAQRFWGCLSAQPVIISSGCPPPHICSRIIINFDRSSQPPFSLTPNNVPKLCRSLMVDISSCTLSPGNKVQIVLFWRRRGDNLGPVTDTDPAPFIEVLADISLRIRYLGGRMVVSYIRQTLLSIIFWTSYGHWPLFSSIRLDWHFLVITSMPYKWKMIWRHWLSDLLFFLSAHLIWLSELPSNIVWFLFETVLVVYILSKQFVVSLCRKLFATYMRHLLLNCLNWL